jgi:hypothetical protein
VGESRARRVRVARRGVRTAGREDSR